MGDTNVAYYRIYGRSNFAINKSACHIRRGSLKRLTGLQNGTTYYFHVTAVNKQGVEGPSSNEQSTTVNIINPGQTMVSNGDFSQGTSSWAWSVINGASAAWAIESGVSHFYITNGTGGLANIQLKQTGKAVIQGKTYVLEFRCLVFLAAIYSGGGRAKCVPESVLRRNHQRLCDPPSIIITVTSLP